MKFRIVNPPKHKRRVKSRRRGFSAKQLAAQRKFTATMKSGGFRKRRSRRARRAVSIKIQNPSNLMARKHRRSRRSNPRRHHARRRRNPIAIANPRRRRSHRCRNPARAFGGSVRGLELLKDALAVGVGYVGASSVKSVVLKFIPLTGTAEQITGIASKFLTGFIALWAGRQFRMPRFGRDAAVGAFLNGSFDVVAVVMGKPLALGEYLAPRTMALAAGRRLRLGAYPAGFRVMPSARVASGALTRSLPRAF
jgi:hypothetical protein